MQQAVPQTTLQAMALNELSGNFDLVINATSASLTGEALVLPESLSFHYAYEMAMAKLQAFWTKPKHAE